MNDLRIALFDFDGTLIDSANTIIRLSRLACEVSGARVPSAEEVRSNIGQGLMIAALSYADGDEELARAIFDNYRAQARLELSAKDKEADPLFEGAEAALKRLADQGWLLGIVTNKGRHGLNALLDHYQLTSLFDVTLTADDVSVKPAPDMALEALSRTGTIATRAALIGDTLNDANCAKNAHVGFVGVSWGYHDDDELRQAGAFHIASDFPDLVNVLNAHIPA